MRVLIPIAFATSALSACAAPQEGPDKMAATLATCWRHAVEGPGGPSSMVGGGGFNSLMLNRSRLETNADRREAIYRDCLAQRGYALEPGPLQTINPSQLGALPVQFGSV
jgi:hypothetical protein